MEYAQATQLGTNAKPQPELGRIKAAAERVGAATANVSYFLGRFHGPQPEGPATSAQPVCTDCYRNDLESLFDALSHLETAVAALDQIG